MLPCLKCENLKYYLMVTIPFWFLEAFWIIPNLPFLSCGNTIIFQFTELIIVLSVSLLFHHLVTVKDAILRGYQQGQTQNEFGNEFRMKQLIIYSFLMWRIVCGRVDKKRKLGRSAMVVLLDRKILYLLQYQRYQPLSSHYPNSFSICRALQKEVCEEAVHQ